MAEFVEVMPQFARLCDYYSQSGCHGCPVDEEGFNCACDKQGCSKTGAEDLEYIIMSWAAEHPEPVYPTWGEWLEKQGVVKIVHSPRYEENGASYYTPMYEITNPIPADIAQKLGLEPKEG